MDQDEPRLTVACGGGAGGRFRPAPALIRNSSRLRFACSAARRGAERVCIIDRIECIKTNAATGGGIIGRGSAQRTHGTRILQTDDCSLFFLSYSHGTYSSCGTQGPCIALYQRSCLSELTRRWSLDAGLRRPPDRVHSERARPRECFPRGMSWDESSTQKSGRPSWSPSIIARSQGPESTLNGGRIDFDGYSRT
jgi:hypothetical protein